MRGSVLRAAGEPRRFRLQDQVPLLEDACELVREACSVDKYTYPLLDRCWHEMSRNGPTLPIFVKDRVLFLLKKSSDFE